MAAAVLERVSANEARRLDKVIQPLDEAGTFLTNNYDQLLNQYGEQWIGIRGKKVVAHSPTWTGLKRKVARSPSSRTFVVFLTRKKQALIL